MWGLVSITTVSTSPILGTRKERGKENEVGEEGCESRLTRDRRLLS